jgi:hypothetical protein
MKNDNFLDIIRIVGDISILVENIDNPLVKIIREIVNDHDSTTSGELHMTLFTLLNYENN